LCSADSNISIEETVAVLYTIYFINKLVRETHAEYVKEEKNYQIEPENLIISIKEFRRRRKWYHLW